MYILMRTRVSCWRYNGYTIRGYIMLTSYQGSGFPYCSLSKEVVQRIRARPDEPDDTIAHSSRATHLNTYEFRRHRVFETTRPRRPANLLSSRVTNWKEIRSVSQLQRTRGVKL